ncbi:hypothetical protein DFH09DRAFT_1346759 [Mycena vulgaris]|nr:hypothetical protein DFH09DRAFT_1346759 [Mycena vulgaris]
MSLERFCSIPEVSSTYGPWLISLFLQTILYGTGLLQAWLYFSWYEDGKSITLAVVFVVSDSFQLVSNYLTAFIVQSFFAARIYYLTPRRSKYSKIAKFVTCVVALLATTQLAAGIAQTILSYKFGSYSKLSGAKIVSIVQVAGSLACDVVITAYICWFFRTDAQGLSRKTKRLLNTLMVDAINRGILMSVTSAATMIIYTVSPDTFWFYLSLAPNSKLYLNTMLATLNSRRHIRATYDSDHTIELGNMSRANGNRQAPGGQAPTSAVEFAKISVSVAPNSEALLHLSPRNALVHLPKPRTSLIFDFNDFSSFSTASFSFRQVRGACLCLNDPVATNRYEVRARPTRCLPSSSDKWGLYTSVIRMHRPTRRARCALATRRQTRALRAPLNAKIAVGAAMSVTEPGVVRLLLGGALRGEDWRGSRRPHEISATSSTGKYSTTQIMARAQGLSRIIEIVEGLVTYPVWPILRYRLCTRPIQFFWRELESSTLSMVGFLGADLPHRSTPDTQRLTPPELPCPPLIPPTNPAPLEPARFRGRATSTAPHVRRHPAIPPPAPLRPRDPRLRCTLGTQRLTLRELPDEPPPPWAQLRFCLGITPP